MQLDRNSEICSTEWSVMMGAGVGIVRQRRKPIVCQRGHAIIETLRRYVDVEIRHLPHGGIGIELREEMRATLQKQRRYARRVENFGDLDGFVAKLDMLASLESGEA